MTAFPETPLKYSLQEGVHVKDRGNVALPVDVVSVLKTQDENYVRTMRSAGLKVRGSTTPMYCLLTLVIQKIDKIKNRLTTSVDLVKPTTSSQTSSLQLDAQELEVLKEAGIIAGSSKGRRRRSKHVVFVDNQEQGLSRQRGRRITK